MTPSYKACKEKLMNSKTRIIPSGTLSSFSLKAKITRAM